MADASIPRDALRRLLAPALAQLGESLEILAEDLLGEEDGRIDWVAAGPEGRAAVVLIAGEVGGAALLEAGLVQRAWVAARLADWRKLAPELPLRVEAPPRLLLIARDFGRTTRLAAREAGADRIELARWSAAPGSGRIEITRLDPWPAPGAPAAAPAAPRRPPSPFRTGLREADLAGGNAT